MGIYSELKFLGFYEENGFNIGKITLDYLEKCDITRKEINATFK